MGASRDFPGSGANYINVDTAWDGDNVSYTWAAWVNFDVLSGTIVALSNNNSNQYLLSTISTKARLRINTLDGAIAADSTTDLTINKWWFMLSTYNHTTGHGTINLGDGTSPVTEEGTDTDTSALDNASSANHRIGVRNASGNPLDGKIAHVQIWERVLTEAEMREVQYKPGSVTASLVAYLPLAGPNYLTDYTGLTSPSVTGTASDDNSGPPVHFPHMI